MLFLKIQSLQVEIIRGHAVIVLAYQKSELMAFVNPRLVLLFPQHGVLSCSVGLAHCEVVAEDAVIESPAEFEDSCVTDLLASSNAHYMLRSCLQEHLPGELRVAARHEHELQFRLTGLDELGQPLFRYEVSVAVAVLEDKEVALALSLVVWEKALVILNAMAAEVEGDRLLCHNHPEILNSRYHFAIAHAIPSFLELLQNFCELCLIINSRHGRHLHLAIAGSQVHHKRRAEKRGKVYFSMSKMKVRLRDCLQSVS